SPKSCKHRYQGGTMTSGTSLGGIVTFEETTHAACDAKLLRGSAKTVTAEDCATSSASGRQRRQPSCDQLPRNQREGRGLLQRAWRAIQPAVGSSNDRGTQRRPLRRPYCTAPSSFRPWRSSRPKNDPIFGVLGSPVMTPLGHG